MENKKILVLGTGNAQKDIITEAKNKGFYVYGCSYRSGDSAEKLLDEFAEINITDVPAVKQYVEANGIDYVYSVGSDIAMPTAAKVSEELSLPLLVSSQTAKVCNEKAELRKALGTDFEWNIPFQFLTDADEEINLEYPFMLKPVDSQGQRGVFRIDSHEEFVNKFPISMSHSRTKGVIIEKFIDGDEVSVNTFSRNGELLFYLLSDRIVWDQFPGGIIKKHLIPSKYENSKTAQDVHKLVEDTLQKLGITEGPAYFQIKIDQDGKPYLIEVTPRLDGCHMWRLINKYCGVNLLEATLDLLTGKSDLMLNPVFPDDKAVSLEFMCQAPGSSVVRADHDTEGADYIDWYYKDGDSVRKMNGYMEKCGYQIRETD